MAKRNIPVDLFYASYNSDCTYELNSRRKNPLKNNKNLFCWNVALLHESIFSWFFPTALVDQALTSTL